MDLSGLERWWKGLDKRRLILGALLFCITFGVTALARWDLDISYQVGRDQVDAGVYATLGDVCVFWNVLIMGGPYGALISALGMALADLAVGSPLYIIGSLLIKSGLAAFIAAFANQCNTWKKCFAVAGVAEGLTALAYFFYDLLFVSYGVAIRALPVNLLQAAVCGALGAVVLHYLPVQRPDKMPRVKRKTRKKPEDDDLNLWEN